MVIFHTNVCLARIAAQEGVRDVISGDDEHNHEDIVFFNLVALYGEMTNQTRLDWVEKAIRVVENTKFI